MKQFGKVLLLALGFGVLAAVLSFFTNGRVDAQVGGRNVNVTNPASSPVLVRDVDNAARQAFQGKATVAAGGQFGDATVVTVPAGKLLVIEYVSVEVALPTGQRTLARITLSKGSNQNKVFLYALPLSLQGTFPADEFAAGQPTRLYADAGTDVKVQLFRSSNTGAAVGVFTISGYLVNCGAGAGCPLP